MKRESDIARLIERFLRARESGSEDLAFHRQELADAMHPYERIYYTDYSSTRWKLKSKWLYVSRRWTVDVRRDNSRLSTDWWDHEPMAEELSRLERLYVSKKAEE